MTTLAPTALPLLGSTEPRIWTRPLRELTSETSAGFAAIDFARQVMRVRLLPWQEFWLIHALELNPDGTFRFSVLLTLVARQNGKTFQLKVVVLWFLYVRSLTLNHPALVLSCAQDLRTAREFWISGVDLAESVPDMNREISGIRYGAGEQCLTVSSGARFMLTSSSRSAGRGLSVDCLVMDELREQRTRAAWAALQNTTAARAGAITFGISNQGDDESVVLNELRDSALSESSPRVGIMEWSAEDGCDPDDENQWTKANPGLGRTITIEKLRTIRATSSLADWRTENLCQRVDSLNSAISPEAWRASAIEGLTLKLVRDQIVACVDVGVDCDHVTLVLAAQVGDVVAVEVAGAWTDTDTARHELGGVLARVKPRALGWFPGGTAGVLGVEIVGSHGKSVGRPIYDGTFPDHSPGVVGMTGVEVTNACATFADLVEHRAFKHRSSSLLDAHIASASRYEQGEAGAWRFARKGQKPIDAVYAMAGAVQLARSLPAYKPPPKAAIY